MKDMTKTPAFRAAEERYLSPPEPPASPEEGENPPTEATVGLHHAIQLARPVLMAIMNDEERPQWLRERSEAALRRCDNAMIDADEEFPDFDFYSKDA